MFSLTDSRDFLNLALALSVLVLTFLVAWILVYIIKIFRDVQRVIHDTTRVVEKLSDVLDVVRDKVNSVAAVIPLLVKSGEKVVEFVHTMREKREATNDQEPKTARNRNKK